MLLTIETANLNMTPDELSKYKSLFKWILARRRIRGNIIIPLDGHGGIGTCKTEEFHEVVAKNGNGGNQ